MILGIDVGGTKCLIGIEINNKVVYNKFTTGNTFTSDNLIQYINKCINKSVNIISICISIPGFIGSDGKIGMCECPKLTGINIKELLHKQYKVSLNNISVINDPVASIAVILSYILIYL